MSDYDYDSRGSGGVFFTLIQIGIFLTVFVAMFILVIYPTLFPSEQKKLEQKQFEVKWQHDQQSITKMNCQQLQQIRLDKISGKNISPYADHWDTVRDTYNTLSCGVPWNWWED